MSVQAISAEVYHTCRQTFLQCNEFESNGALRAVFITEELATLRDHLRDGASRAERVDGCLDLLLSRRTASGAVAIFPFLQALIQRYAAGDALHARLVALLQALTLNDSAQPQFLPGMLDVSIKVHSFLREIRMVSNIGKTREVAQARLEELIVSFSGALAAEVVTTIVKPPLYEWLHARIKTVREVEAVVEEAVQRFMTSEAPDRLFDQTLTDWLRSVFDEMSKTTAKLYADYRIAERKPQFAQLYERFKADLRSLREQQLNLSGATDTLDKKLLVGATSFGIYGVSALSGIGLSIVVMAAVTGFVSAALLGLVALFGGMFGGAALSVTVARRLEAAYKGVNVPLPLRSRANIDTHLTKLESDIARTTAERVRPHVQGEAFLDYVEATIAHMIDGQANEAARFIR
jgi:hypothetical protein